MVDPTPRPPRTIFVTIADVRYGLLLDFNALCDVEDVTGLAVGIVTQSGQIKHARALTWAALNGWVRRDRPKGRTPFTVTQAGDVVDEWLQEPGGAQAMRAVLVQLGNAAFPEAAKSQEADPAPGN